MSSVYTSVIGAGTAINSIASTPGCYLVRPSYDHGDAAGIYVDTDNVHIKLAGYCSTAITGAFVVTSYDSSLEIGPGWTIGIIDLTGCERFTLKLHNGCSVSDISCTNLAPDYLSIKGFGWGAQVRSIYNSNGGHCLFDGFSVDSSTNAFVNAVEADDGTGPFIIKFLRIIDSANEGVRIVTPGCLLYGSVVVDSTGHAISVEDSKNRVLNNVVMTTSDEPLRVETNGDDSIIDGNYFKGTNVPQLASGSNDCVFTRNRCADGAVTDNGTGNTIQDNSNFV